MSGMGISLSFGTVMPLGIRRLPTKTLRGSDLAPNHSIRKISPKSLERLGLVKSQARGPARPVFWEFTHPRHLCEGSARDP